MWLSQGKSVHLVDGQESQLRDAVTFIQQLQRDAGQKSGASIFTHAPEELEAALFDSWLVVECVPEKIELKRKVLAQLDTAAPLDTIVASNSSSYPISELIEGLDLNGVHRVLSAHSYWPPETPAIEIMGHSSTDPACIDLMMERCRQHGFEPFRVKQDSMGYIYNRIWAAIKREALLAASEGVASPEEIDNIFKSVLKTPKGPFEQMDVVGLDVVLDIEEHYAAKRGNIPQEPRTYLKDFIGNGLLGVKSGAGFYEYKSDSKQ